MEIWTNPWVVGWLITGLVVALGGLLVDKDMYTWGKTDFEEGEFSVGMFLIFVAFGPIAIPYIIYDLIKTETIIRKHNSRVDELEAEEEEKRKNAAKKRQEKRDKIKGEIPALVEELDRLGERMNEEDSILDRQLFEDVRSLCERAKALNKTDLKKDQRGRLIALAKFARLKVSTELRHEADVNELTEIFSTLLRSSVRKFGEKEKGKEAAGEN